MTDSYELVRQINRIKILTDRIEDKAKKLGANIEIVFGLVEKRKGEADVTTAKWFDLEISRDEDTIYWNSFDNLNDLESAVNSILVGVALCQKESEVSV